MLNTHIHDFTRYSKSLNRADVITPLLWEGYCGFDLTWKHRSAVIRHRPLPGFYDPDGSTTPCLMKNIFLPLCRVFIFNFISSIDKCLEKNSINSLYCACLKIPSCVFLRNVVTVHWTKSKKSYTKTIYFYIEVVDIRRTILQTSQSRQKNWTTSFILFQLFNIKH